MKKPKSKATPKASESQKENDSSDDEHFCEGLPGGVIVQWKSPEARRAAIKGLAEKLKRN